MAVQSCKVKLPRRDMSLKQARKAVGVIADNFPGTKIREEKSELERSTGVTFWCFTLIGDDIKDKLKNLDVI